MAKAARHFTQGAGFKDRLLARIDKLDPDQLRSTVGRLAGQREFFMKVFDHLDEGLIVVDLDLSIQFVNRRARSMLGLRRDRDLTGVDLGEQVGPAHALHEVIESLRGRTRAVDGHEAPFGPDEDRILSLSTLPMRMDMAGAEPGEDGDWLIVLLHDVTERHARQVEQARARRLASMATLTAGIAHEIKNPLNALNIHVQLLRGEIEKLGRGEAERARPRLERASEVIIEETERLGRIVEEFLQAARPRSPQLASHDLSGLFDSIARIFATECERRGIELNLSVEPGLPPIMLDEHMMVQALRNLTRNALDALEEKKREQELYQPRLTLEARANGDNVEIIIADNGPGIADEDLEHIFEAYYTTKHGGTGLGLMVVYRIVTEHRGALHVDTQSGEGSRFVITLPMHQKPIRLLSQPAEAPPVVIREKGSEAGEATGENEP